MSNGYIELHINDNIVYTESYDSLSQFEAALILAKRYVKKRFKGFLLIKYPDASYINYYTYGYPEFTLDNIDKINCGKSNLYDLDKILKEEKEYNRFLLGIEISDEDDLPF